MYVIEYNTWLNKAAHPVSADVGWSIKGAGLSSVGQLQLSIKYGRCLFTPYVMFYPVLSLFDIWIHFMSHIFKYIVECSSIIIKTGSSGPANIGWSIKHGRLSGIGWCQLSINYGSCSPLAGGIKYISHHWSLCSSLSKAQSPMMMSTLIFSPHGKGNGLPVLHCLHPFLSVNSLIS